jgi:hypothetical protein
MNWWIAVVRQVVPITPTGDSTSPGGSDVI